MSGTAADIVAIREIEAWPAPMRFARGWHRLGLSWAFRDGRRHRVRAFGRKFVIFAGGDGAGGVPADAAVCIATFLGDFVRVGFEKDVAIWRSKARTDNSLLREKLGPVCQLRRCYEQFYVEVDTTNPREAFCPVERANLAERSGSVARR